MKRFPHKSRWCLSIGTLLAALALLHGCASSSAVEDTQDEPAAVRAFFRENGRDFTRYRLSDVSDPGLFFRHERDYFVRASPDELWSAYVNQDPREAWRTPMTRFGAVWDPASGCSTGPLEAEVPRFTAGQIYVLELRIAGFLRIPAAFEITRIDVANRIIEFVYLEENLSHGVQRIRIRPFRGPDGSDAALIEHFTLYRSGRAFRDRWIYAPFHTRIIDAFHKGVLNRCGFEWNVQPVLFSPR